MIVTGSNIDTCFRDISDSEVLSIDTETTGLRPYHGDTIFSAIVATLNESYYFNFKNYGDGSPLLPRDILPDLYELVRGKKCYFANTKFDLHFLTNEGWGTDFNPWDVLVIDKCIYNKYFKYDLSSVAERMGLGAKDDAVREYISKHRLYDKVIIPGKKSPQANPRFDKVPFDIISKYAMRDARLTYDIGELQAKKVKELDAKYRTINGYDVSFEELIKDENRLTKVLFEIEKRGLQTDGEYIKKAIEREEKRINRARELFRTATGFDFIDSNKHLDRVFSELGFVGGRTGKGNASYTDDVLKGIKHEAAEAVMEYRDAYKRLNTYYHSFTFHRDWEGIIRPNFKQAGADSFRFSITNPALQTLNSEDAGEWRVRDSFVSRRGFFFTSIDYQAQETRLCADRAGETKLISDINTGVDVHQATASLVGVERKKAKVIAFMLLYGGGAQNLADSLGISLEEAKRLKNRYFEKLPAIANFIRSAAATAERRGYVFNFAGRILHFPIIKFNDGQSRMTYKAVNYLIQSSGAEIMRRSLLALHDFLSDKKSKIVMSLHDEVLLEIHESEKHLIEEIKNIMNSAYIPINGLPMRTEHTSGRSWGEL